MPTTKYCFADSIDAEARILAQRRGGQKSLLNYLPNGKKENPSAAEGEGRIFFKKNSNRDFLDDAAAKAVQRAD